MQLPIGVRIRKTRKDPALASLMKKECEGLEEFNPRITSCKTTLEKEEKSKLPSGLYRVKAEVTFPPRHKIVVKKEAELNGEPAMLEKLIRETFEKAGYAIERIKEKRLARIKGHHRKGLE